jgi:hypothetical protein
MGEETVLADSGREGEIAARVGRVRSLAFLSILRLIEHQFHVKGFNGVLWINQVFPQPVRAERIGLSAGIWKVENYVSSSAGASHDH